MKLLFALMEQFHLSRDVEHSGSASKPEVIRFVSQFPSSRNMASCCFIAKADTTLWRTLLSFRSNPPAKAASALKLSRWPFRCGSLRTNEQRESEARCERVVRPPEGQEPKLQRWDRMLD